MVNNQPSYQQELLSSRIILLFDEAITPSVSERIITLLLKLEADDPNAPIYLYINSYGDYYGGLYSPIFSIYDVMNKIQSPVYTIGMGVAYAGAALLLAAGNKRYITPNTEVVLRQPKGSAGGSVDDILIHAEQMLENKKEFIKLLSKHTGQPENKIEKDIDREFILYGEEVINYGIADEILKAR